MPRAEAEAPPRPHVGRASGTGPKSWELCYQVGGIREGLYESDQEEWPKPPLASVSAIPHVDVPGDRVADLDGRFGRSLWVAGGWAA